MHEAAHKIDFDPLSKEVVDCAFKIHQTMGAGYLKRFMRIALKLN